jgi:hypothetical protein
VVGSTVDCLVCGNVVSGLWIRSLGPPVCVIRVIVDVVFYSDEKTGNQKLETKNQKP